MKRIFASITVVALFVSLFALSSVWTRGQSNQVVSLVPAVQAQEIDRVANQKSDVFPRRRECTQGASSGRYGILIQGTVLPPNLPAATNIVAVGTFELDVAGNLTGADTLSLGGQIIPRTYSGTVNVKSDCTFTSRFTVNTGPLTGLAVTSSGVIVDDGNEIQFVETDPGTLATAVAKRM